MRRILQILKRPIELTVIQAAIWLAFVADWMWFDRQLPNWSHWIEFPLALVTAIAWVCWALWPSRRDRIAVFSILSCAYVVVWQFGVFLTDELVLDSIKVNLARAGTAGLFLIGLCWVVWATERAATGFSSLRREGPPDLGPELTTVCLLSIVFPFAIPVWGRRKSIPIQIAALVGFCLGTTVWLAVVLYPVYLLSDIQSITSVADFVSRWLDPTAVFRRIVLFMLPIAVSATSCIGFWWFRIDRKNVSEELGASQPALLEEAQRYSWNPFDADAWYYGRRQKKLNQSLTVLLGYSFCFTIAFLVASQIGGCREVYELPAGGGEQANIKQKVKIQKVIKKKYVVNPFSSILFHVPPIDEVKLNLSEITKHAYKVGYGEGAGAGFAGGTKRGKVRFIRLEYTGGDWNQDFGIGADLNMLLEYGIRTRHKVAERTESRTVSQLKNFPKGKSPPMVYMTGQKNISLSKSETKILREYLLEKHGMIFGDNGGSTRFHSQFVAMMNRVLPNTRYVTVPLDDVIHSRPYKIPFLPYVAPHGGKNALGWKVDGRWVCYYHPGDIGDAWSDGHAGVDPVIYEACYQLGSNVIFYAHSEYAKWLQAQKLNK